MTFNTLNYDSYSNPRRHFCNFQGQLAFADGLVGSRRSKNYIISKKLMTTPSAFKLQLTSSDKLCDVHLQASFHVENDSSGLKALIYYFYVSLCCFFMIPSGFKLVLQDARDRDRTKRLSLAVVSLAAVLDFSFIMDFFLTGESDQGLSTRAPSPTSCFCS